MVSRRLVLWFVLLMLVLVREGQADGVIRDSLGARSSGRGGTNLAFSDNGEILYDNPAGMTGIDGYQLVELGVDVLITDLEYADADNGWTSAANNPFPVGQFSYIRRSENGVWAYGLGAYSVAGFSSQYKLMAPAPFGGTHQYKSIGMMAKMLPALACRVTDRLTIGGTFGVAASHMELEGPYYLQGPHFLAGTPIMLDLQASGAAPTWSFGMQLELTERTTLGVAYTSPTSFQLHGNAEVAIAGGGGSTRYDTRLDVTWPESIGLGIKHQLCRHHILGADVVWYNWSQAFDKFRLKFDNSTNGAFPSVNEEFPLLWRDSVSVRVGYEWHPVENRVFRLGYIYHRNPVPNSTISPFIQATLQNAFSIGYGWKTASCLEIDLAYQYSFGTEQNVGTSGLLGGDFDNSRHRAQAHWVFASIMRRF